MSESKSQYELLREAKISRNNERLKELGLLRQHKNKRRRNNPVASVSVPSIERPPIRRSGRLQQSKEDNKEDTRIEKKSDVPLRLGEHLVTRPRNLPSSINPRDVAKNLDNIDELFKREQKVLSSKTKDLIISIDNILSSCLGKYVSSKMGKAAVIEYVSGSAHVSFNKYSGVLEWKNSLFLWVNLGGPNKFIEKGTKMTWFGGSRMHDETPVIKRLLKSKTNSDDIILWCRFMDGSQAQPYICLGRLTYVSHTPGTRPLEFVWELLDYDKLQAGRVQAGSLFSKIITF